MGLGSDESMRNIHGGAFAFLNSEMAVMVYRWWSPRGFVRSYGGRLTRVDAAFDSRSAGSTAHIRHWILGFLKR